MNSGFLTLISIFCLHCCLQVTSVAPSYPASASCSLQVVPPLGLTVLHPPLQNGTLYLQPNNTRVLLRVQTRFPTNVSQHGSGHSIAFQIDCPATDAALCRPGPSSGPGAGEPSVFAVLELSLPAEQQGVQLQLEASNNVTSARLTVVVHLEEPVRGLMVQPHPAHRVLMESVVVGTLPAFTAQCVFCVFMCVFVC